MLITSFPFAVLLITIVVIAKGDEDINCHQRGILVYEDLGCKPVKDKLDDPCPSEYDCRHFHDFGVHCYFQGQKYDGGDRIPPNLTRITCNAGCLCTREGAFTCATFSCPDLGLNGQPPNPDCVRTYNLNDCCATGERCPPFEDVAKCEVDGVIYREGERFYPKSTCSVCTCQKGFAGKFESPFCRQTSCAVELNNRSDLEKHCAPVYENKDPLCCPIFWTCLSEDDVINPTDEVSPTKKGCIFGNKNVKIGETIQKIVERYGKNHVVKCECSLPPLLTCIAEKPQ